MTHSPFHSAGKAFCKTPWSKLAGDDIVRTCPTCESQVFQLQGLAEPEAAELVISRAPAESETLRMHRRNDGTFVMTNRPCHWLWFPQSYWSDWRSSLSLTFDVLKRSPWMTLLFVLTYLVPVNNIVVNLVTGCLTAMLSCRIINAYSKHSNAEDWRPSGADLERSTSAFWISWLYGVAVMVGLVLLIVPGLIWAVRYSLAIVFTCLEKTPTRASLDSSSRLVKGHTWQAARYLAPPVVVAVALFCGVILLCSIFEAFSPKSQLAITLFAGACWAVIGTIWLSVLPMQVRLYQRLTSLAKEITTAP